MCTEPYSIFDKVIALNFERMRVHFLSDSFAAVPSADLRQIRRSNSGPWPDMMDYYAWTKHRHTKVMDRNDWTSLTRGTLIYMCRPSWSVDISGKINHNILVSAFQLFRWMVRMVHYERSTIACSQTLYFLFRDCPARVWNTNREGFIDRKRKGLVVGKRENRRKSISFFFSRALAQQQQVAHQPGNS